MSTSLYLLLFGAMLFMFIQIIMTRFDQPEEALMKLPLDKIMFLNKVALSALFFMFSGLFLFVFGV